MSDQQAGQPAFRQMWPTTFMQVQLPGAEGANAALIELIEEMDDKASDLTTDYLAGNFFKHEHPAANWLKQCTDRAIRDYAKESGIDYELDYSVQAWPNVNRFGDYHNLHNHPHSWLSGTYYVQVPERPRDLHTRSDLNPGAISFYDPRPQANMLSIKGDGQVDPEYRLLPRPGMLLLWPAFVHHLVHPNLSDDKRISVSFNVVLKWRDTYLP
ncbi:TIGR02466 family protein [Tepidamorphus sp. 3E244]|uniref:TIGR02466 family protein n=1 Tax=Tepidamorphus sp. 3E244 TaxID=3385498 RepID=UPI0038FCA71A